MQIDRTELEQAIRDEAEANHHANQRDFFVMTFGMRPSERDDFTWRLMGALMLVVEPDIFLTCMKSVRESAVAAYTASEPSNPSISIRA